MPFILVFKSNNSSVMCEVNNEPITSNSYEDAKRQLEAFGHVGEEFITIKEIKNP